MVIFDDLQILKKLGSGMFATNYLVKTTKNNEYVLKIQKILYSQEELKNNKKDFNNEIWREIDLYEFINTLNKNDQIFFQKLYDYKIVDNCDHIQERPIKIEKCDDIFNKLDESKWCIKLLLEYKEGDTITDFLMKNKLTEKQVYSVLLQICKVMLILNEAGYSHNDLHCDNIIINKTDKKYFNLLDKKIPYNGYQISVIDYGMVLNKKFGIKYDFNNKVFIDDIKKHFFNEMFYATYLIINNSSIYIADCVKAKKKLPWERKNYSGSYSIKKMVLNHPEFYRTTKNKYLKMYPKAKRLLNYFEKNIETKKEIYEIINNKKNQEDFWNVINKTYYEFHLLFPKKYAKYEKWCSHHEHLLPKDVVLNLLIIDNYNNYVNYLITKCLE
jgi:serine/threonine protein kinase